MRAASSRGGRGGRGRGSASAGVPAPDLVEGGELALNRTPTGVGEDAISEGGFASGADSPTEVPPSAVAAAAGGVFGDDFMTAADCGDGADDADFNRAKEQFEVEAAMAESLREHA